MVANSSPRRLPPPPPCCRSGRSCRRPSRPGCRRRRGWRSRRVAKWSRPRLGLISGRAAELGERDHQRVLEQPALLEVVEQRRHDVVELGDHLLVGLEVLAVAVPPGAGHADERDARLDQPAGDQRLLAELRRPVLVADLLRLARDVEERLAGHQAADALVRHVVAAQRVATTGPCRTACSAGRGARRARRGRAR